MRFRRKLPLHCFWAAIILAELIGEVRLGAAPGPSDTAQAPAPTTNKELRHKAAERRRRIIINDDGGEPSKEMTEPTAEDLLKQHTTVLAGTQVDSLAYCTQTVGLDVLTYFTKVGTVFTSSEGQYANNKMEALLAKGIDPLRVIVDYGKQHSLEVFWSLRMNDTHDASPHVEYGPILLRANRFKSAHPEYLLGTPDKHPKNGAWTALDYGRPEVRERAFRLIEEVCRNYDIDGVELDFFRHPVFFQSTSRGDKASDKDRAAMTELMVRIRKMADEVGQSRGRPILIAVRIPDSVEYCRAIGLDLEHWMATDLLDLYIPGGYFQINDWEYSVSLGHKYGVKVYASLDDVRFKEASVKALRSNNRVYRARAAEAWHAGVDGIYLFNFPDQFISDAALLSELGSPQTLAALDKDYFASYRGVHKAAGGNLPFEPYLHLETLNPENPRTIDPGETASARLYLGDDREYAAMARQKLRLKLVEVRVPEHVRVTLNGHVLKMVAAGADGWLESSPIHSNSQPGRNVVEIALSKQANKSAIWSDVVLLVRNTEQK
jgi:Glycosyl hydrolase-like 10